MPKLLLFAACEKVIVGQDGAVSMISIFQSIRLRPPGDSVEAAKAQVPFSWCLFALWERDNGEGTDFEQRWQLTDPSDQPLIGSKVALRFDKQFRRVVITMSGFRVAYRIARGFPAGARVAEQATNAAAVLAVGMTPSLRLRKGRAAAHLDRDLLVTQGGDRIDPGGALRREEAGQGRDAEKNGRS